MAYLWEYPNRSRLQRVCRFVVFGKFESRSSSIDGPSVSGENKQKEASQTKSYVLGIILPVDPQRYSRLQTKKAAMERRIKLVSQTNRKQIPRMRGRGHAM